MARYLGIEVTEGQVKGVVVRAAYRVLQIEAVYRFARPAPGPEGLTAAVEAIVREVGAIDASYAAVWAKALRIRRRRVASETCRSRSSSARTAA